MGGGTNMVMMGGFGLIKDYDAIKQAGFDYAELDMPEIEALSEKNFEAFRAHVETVGFPVPTGARILPITEPTFFVPGFKETDLKPYLESTCARSERVGIRKILFGNGKARWLIDENSRQKEQVFISFLRMLCEIAGNHGQEILIEPLGPKYSNYINTLPEAARVIDAVGMPNLGAMADLRHFVWSGEPFEDIKTYRDIVGHFHIDFPLSWPARLWPCVRDGYNYAAYLKYLKGEDVTLTVEADIPEDWMNAGRDARELIEYYMK